MRGVPPSPRVDGLLRRRRVPPRIARIGRWIRLHRASMHRL